MEFFFLYFIEEQEKQHGCHRRSDSVIILNQLFKATFTQQKWLIHAESAKDQKMSY